nr:nitroreductase family protein [Tissierella sp. P1]
MTMNFNQAVEKRRTYYGISKDKVVSDEKVQEIIEHAVKHTPSAFNSQTARVVLLLDKHHTRLWNITKEALRERVAADKFLLQKKRLTHLALDMVQFYSLKILT